MIKILVVCLTLFASCGRWCNVDARLQLSQQEFQLRSQLKALNKPPIKSYKKDDGNIIDCVDIYKQPAFDHPLLKDHKIQMRPSSALQDLAKSLLVQEDETILETKSEMKYDCPSGSVPIRRTRRRDLIRSKSALNHYRTMIRGPPFTSQQGVSFAGVTTQTGKANHYLGAKTFNSLYNLSLINSQVSTASLRIGNGVDGSFTSIEYGWTLNHELYGDTKARTFSLWTADGFQKTGCFNTLCPGFVQVHPGRPMGDEITYFSEYDKSKLFMMYAIIKDPKTKDWWIVESIPDKANQYIGYWPQALFPNMAEFATNVQAGGKVSNPQNRSTSHCQEQVHCSIYTVERSLSALTGHYKSEDFLKTADMLVEVINSTYSFMDDPHMVVVANTPDLYKAQFLDQGEVLYGGPDFPA
ncbi:protein neprosin-like [Silene latifolia]|uniref:protein neprosin-like n=1 Tax=Silene latifolia TaxID=37657 RepID=UPI003D76AF67